MSRSRWTWRGRTHSGRRASFRLECEFMESRELLSTFTVTNASDGPNRLPDSLRWAILAVDADSSVDTIDFDIPGPVFNRLYCRRRCRNSRIRSSSMGRASPYTTVRP